ncbi:hypothetical protein GA707_20040 [Nostocoides sp. F2B08]|uniref:hypothetical protein n=1 Tax=Nostocoides sp. F2B08 TaxID=2653936 RepID=UPI0012637E6D|nr:hypothetical protein [Tetrasphaera sp. F2B08]KAB7739770.1 hypothetical protein GA707_20040 [Tetrasphaera sp. F2B08]
MELIAVFLLKAAGEAVVGLAVTSAGRRGYSALRGLLTRLQDAERLGDPKLVNQVQGALERHLLDHPAEAGDVVDDLLSPQPLFEEAEAPSQPGFTIAQTLITALEGFVATLCVMTWETPSRILAVPGTLGYPEGVTVIDARSEDTMRLPSRYADHDFFLLGRDVSWDSTPRMWVARPAPETSADALARQLTDALATPGTVDAGGLASTERLCAASLAALSGDPQGVRRFARVDAVHARRISLDVKSANEQAMVPPPSLSERVLAHLHQGDEPALPSPRQDYASRVREVAEEQEAAGINAEFLRTSGAGMRRLSAGVTRAYENARAAALALEHEQSDADAAVLAAAGAQESLLKSDVPRDGPST